MATGGSLVVNLAGATESQACETRTCKLGSCGERENLEQLEAEGLQVLENGGARRDFAVAGARSEPLRRQFAAR